MSPSAACRSSQGQDAEVARANVRIPKGRFLAQSGHFRLLKNPNFALNAFRK